jgi:DNA-binding transcriptional ArsR family regulator
VTTAAAPEVDRVLTALADPMRRRLLEAMGSRYASSATVLAGELPVSRQAVAKHLAVLEDANLVASRRAGREVLFTVRPEALTATASWITALADAWDDRLRHLKHLAESDP